jgi:hypothetical protein
VDERKVIRHLPDDSPDHRHRPTEFLRLSVAGARMPG